ncbi:MAG TPA: ATP-grasp domain-containing protein [Burkholderiaceae bacterium]
MSGSVFVFEYLSAGDGAGAHAADLLAEGRAMRDAVAADLRAAGLRVAVAGIDCRPEPDEDRVGFVRRQAVARAACWVVAPESGGLLQRLHAAVCGAAGAARWVGCDARSSAIASSKRATLERLAAHGVATPLDATAARAWVVKPDDGAGCVATRRHADEGAARADLARRRAAGEPATLEPWIDGEPLSLALLCRGGAAELLAVNRQRVSVDAGGLLHLEGVDVAAVAPDDRRRPALRALGDAVARALPGLAGYVGVDLVWNARRGPVAIEVNPRVTSAYVGLSRSLGRNLAREIVAPHLDG